LASGASVAGAAPLSCGPRGSHAVKVLSGRSGGTIALVEAGARRLAFVADEELGVVRTIDATRLAELAVTKVDGRPAQVLPLVDGRLLVTLRDRNQLDVLELGDALDVPLDARCAKATPEEPFGLAVSADGATVALTSGAAHTLSFLASDSLETRRAVDVAAEPRGVLLSDDGKTTYVGHLVGGVISVAPISAGDATSTFVRPPRVERSGGDKPKKAGKTEVPTPPKEQTLAAAQGYALAEISLGRSKDGPWPGRIFVPMASSDPMRFGAESSFPGVYGGSGGPAVIGAFVAVIDPVSHAPLGGEIAAMRQARPEDCILPRGVAASGGHLFVTCMGTNRVVELDARAADPITAEVRRFGTGEGPTGIVVDEAAKRALVFSQFSEELTVIDLAPETKGERVSALPLARPKPTDHEEQIALGRTLFHATRDVRLSFDGRACASCHPEGRADGLTWATPDGPRQTIWLAGRVAKSAPYGWFGDHPTVRQHVRFTVKRLGGSGLEDKPEDERDLEALLAYLSELPAPSRAGAIVEAARSEREARGKALFESAETGCSTCHVGGGTDGQKHDVGSGSPAEASLKFDTPGLGLVGSSAPYFHDGRYRTLDALLADPKSKMGRSSSLDASQRADLVAYLESL
jgi:DNA-binding beta-propeller fold protein YncE/mono/diheme cytochrome c family protein